jgi:CubicO group peptidase (beta-lactamase class C family)
MVKLARYYTLTVLIFLSVLVSVLPAQFVAQDNASKIDNYVKKIVENGQFNGAILVAEDGDVILKKGYGFANMDWEIPNTPDTKFKIGSLTKQFVAMIIMQLAEENKLNIEGKLIDYIPEYRHDTGQKITIHHLLTHTSGIPSYTDFPGFWSDSTRNHYRQEYLIKKFHSGDLQFEPGTKYRYNNSGYFLLAVIIERVTGKSFEENLDERILKPLNMKNTGVDNNVNIIKKKASGYIDLLSGYKKESYFYMPNVLGAGDMYSTVEDLYLWDQALYEEELLSEQYKNLMFTPFLKSYAYGWGIYNLRYSDTSDSIRIVAHSGAIKGFSAQIFRLIDDEHLIILLNNTGQTILWDMCKTIINILNDRTYKRPKRSLVKTLGKTILASGIEYAIIQYHLLKTHKYYEYDFSEKTLNELGYQLVNINRLRDAIDIFKLNIEEHPDASIPYYCLGDVYMMAGRNKLAMKYYEKSLDLNPDNATILKMMEKINQSE